MSAWSPPSGQLQLPGEFLAGAVGTSHAEKRNSQDLSKLAITRPSPGPVIGPHQAERPPASGIGDQHRRLARGLWNALQPHHQHVYVNFLMEEGEDRIREAYGAAKYDRLKALKRKYDPNNFFRLNQNIPPD